MHLISSVMVMSALLPCHHLTVNTKYHILHPEGDLDGCSILSQKFNITTFQKEKYP